MRILNLPQTRTKTAVCLMLVVMNVFVVLLRADSPTVDGYGIILLFVSLVAAKIGFNSVCDKII